MPTLIFSSETVLARQPMTRERAPSVDLSSDEEGSEEVDDEEDHDLGELLEGMNDDCDTSGIDDKATQIPPPGVSSSSSSFSSPLKPSPSDARLSFSRPRPAEWGLSLTTLRRLRNHIIICGPFAHGHQLAGYLDELYHIERPSGYESGTRHVRRPLILLLVKRLPSDQDLENMSPLLPPNVFVERGVSQSVEDLLRVRAHLAKAVLMIPGNWKYHVDELRDETMDEVTEHLLDYQVIVSTLSLRTVQELHHEHLQRSMGNSKSRMIVGASHEPTIACSVVKWHESLTYFALKSSSYTSRDSYETTRKDAQTVPVLPPKMGSRTQRIRHAMREATGRVLQSDPRQDLPLHFAPSYAAGEVFVDSALDTLLYQSFFNPYVIDLVRALAGDYYFGDHPSHATFASSMMEYFQPPRQSRASSSSAPRQTPSNTEPRKESPHDDNGQADAMIEHPVLAVASISEELEGKSFVTIFQHALRQQVLVLGIFRRANDSHRGNTVPYVYTCPKSHAGVTVEHGDVLHVVTRRIPPIVIHFQEGIASH